MYEKAKATNSDYVECDFIWKYEKNEKIDTGYRYKNKKEMFQTGRVVAWNKLIKREIIENNELKFPVGLYYEDVEFFYKLIPHINKFSFIEEPLVYYVQRKSSIVNKQDHRTRHIFIALEHVMNYYIKLGLYDEYKDEIEYTYTRLLLCSSLKRISDIEDEVTKLLIYNETWHNLNRKFPSIGKKNPILKKDNSPKGIYMKLMNKFRLIKFLQNFYRKIKGAKMQLLKKITIKHVLCLYIILCPILDILSFAFRNYFNTNISISTFLRPIIPVMVSIYIFMKANKKNKCILGATAGIYALYAFLHLFVARDFFTGCSYGGFTKELQYIINFTFLIVNLINFYYAFIKNKWRKDENVTNEQTNNLKLTNNIKVAILIMCLIYMASIYLAILTKTSSYTYKGEQIGYKGGLNLEIV